MLTEEGLPTTLAESRRDYQGMLLSEVLDLAQQKLGRPLAPDWLVQYERVRAEAFQCALQPVPGAVDTVESVRAAGIDACVASQGKLEKTRLSLEITGMRGLFPDRALFSAYSVPRGKPHPDLFLHAAARMGAEPARCVVVEDTPSGVVAGVSAGMRVFGYAADSDEAALRAVGATTFSSLDRLPELLTIPPRS